MINIVLSITSPPAPLKKTQSVFEVLVYPFGAIGGTG